MKFTFACLLSLALAASEANNAGKNLRRGLQFENSTPMPTPAPPGNFGGEPSPMDENSSSGGGSDFGGDEFSENSPTVDGGESFGNEAGGIDPSGPFANDEDGGDDDDNDAGGDNPGTAPWDTTPGFGDGGTEESPTVGESESESGSGPENDPFGSQGDNDDGDDDEDDTNSPPQDSEFGGDEGNSSPNTGSSPFDGEDNFGGGDDDDDETPSPTPADDSGSSPFGEEENFGGGDFNDTPSPTPALNDNDNDNDNDSQFGDNSWGDETPSPTPAFSDNGPTFGGGGSGSNNMPTWEGNDNTPAPYSSTNEDPFRPSWNSDAADGTWEWKDSDLEELEHDRTVLVALSVTFALGILLAILTAHQMLQNPRGCCASICRILVACTCAITRCICFPCRSICGCTSKPETRTHERMLAQDVDYANDLELS